MSDKVRIAEPLYVSLAARPYRLGVFVPDIPSVPWEAAFRGAIAATTRVWGGTQSLLVPIGEYAPVGSGHESSELFWELVRLADVDGWAVYTGSVAELELLGSDDAGAAFTRVDELVAAWPEETRDREREELLDQPLVDVELPETLRELLATRGISLEAEVALHPHPLTGGRVGYPLTDVLSIADHPGYVQQPELVGDPALDLLIGAELGVVSAGARAERRSLVTDELLPQGRADAIAWSYGSPPQGVATPRSLAEHGLSWFGSGTMSRTVVLVVGDGPWDFALARALRRAQTFAFWLPADDRWSVAERASALRRVAAFAAQRGAQLLVTSASDETIAEEVAARLPAGRGVGSPQARAWQHTIPERGGQRLLVDGAVLSPEPYYLHDGSTPPLPTPVPQVRAHDVTALRWMIEVGADGWSAARSPRMAAATMPGVEARVTRSGLAYACPQPLVFSGVPLEYQVSRPRLHALNPLEQLEHLASAGGWRCAPSDKGRFAAAATRLFGGFAALCEELRDVDVGQLLALYQDGDPDAPGLALGDRRRYPSLSELRARTWVQDVGDLVAGLEERGILHRGVVLKCDNCRQTAFYRPSDAFPCFFCRRCGESSRPTRASWMTEPEPLWRYGLDEVVFQFVRHRGDLAVLAVYDRFGAISHQPVFELEVFDPQETKSELDFVVLDGADVWLGEAFSADRYAPGRRAEGERLARLAVVATLFNARGVLLATAAPALAPVTAEAAHRRLAGLARRLELQPAVVALQRPAKPIDAAG